VKVGLKATACGIPRVAGGISPGIFQEVKRFCFFPEFLFLCCSLRTSLLSFSPTFFVPILRRGGSFGAWGTCAKRGREAEG
jgi:hypothetical protein